MQGGSRLAVASRCQAALCDVRQGQTADQRLPCLKQTRPPARRRAELAKRQPACLEPELVVWTRQPGRRGRRVWSYVPVICTQSVRHGCRCPFPCAPTSP